jgi:hypothetical protein
VRSTASIVIVAVAGLLVALAALLDDGRAASALPHVRVIAKVPDALLAAAGTVFVVAWILIMMAARAKRKPEEDPESRPQPSWRQVFAPVIAMLPLIAAVVILWLDGGRLAGALLALSQGWFGGMAGQTTAGEEPIVLSLPWLGWGLGFISLGVALATLALAVLLLFSDRLLAWYLAPRARTERAEIVAAVDESLEDLDDTADPRLAIINCYRRFERVTARAQVRRAPWQTPGEFMRDALARLSLPAAPVERLTRLFEIARFSQHALGAADRERARACLEEIRRAAEPAEDAVAVA